ncbi:hypothetical protein [Leadbetterella sp. DM7]
MKKYIAFSLLVVGLLATSCRKQTCPAYSSIDEKAVENPIF